MGKSTSFKNERHLTLSEKINRRITEKKTQGLIPHADFLNKWTPYFFIFTLTGGVAWVSLCTVYQHHGNDPIWVTINQIFEWYLAAQLLVNWFLIRRTDSSYRPETHGTSQLETQILINDQATNDVSPNLHAHPANNALGYKMMVATGLKDGVVQRKSFPYWSWVPCLMCQRPRPPRCHHCTVCKKCVLKRDHHCYFARACVGVNNVKFFMFFCFWSIVLTTFSLLQLVPYLFRRILYNNNYIDLFIPFNVYHGLTGQLPLLHLHYIVVTWSVLFLSFIALGMFSITLYLVLRGLTKFEYDHGINIKDTRTMTSRLRAALGRNWLIPLLLPGVGVVDCNEDAVLWPYIKL